jgi:phage terminase large subunit-like protein
MTITESQRETLRFQLEKSLWQRDFLEFVKKAVTIIEPQTTFSFNWHIEYLCNVAQRIVEDVAHGVPKDKDIIINVPPRSMKSLIWSVMLNAWAWTRYPHLKFMTISYADNLSAKFAYKTRLLIKSDWYQKYFGDVFQLSDDDNRKTSYSNNKTGTRESFGSTGSVTGSGADIILCDDLNKPNDVSDTKLDNVISVYRDTIFNRLNFPLIGYRVVIAQRCHERDITGHLLSTDADSYEHICLPAQLSKDVKPLELGLNYVNGLLWTDRFSMEVLHQYDKNTFMYASQYLQNPLSLDDGMIKKSWFSIIDKNSIPDDVFNSLKWEMYLDTAYTTNEKQDESACLIGAKYNNDVLIKKAYVWYLEFPQLLKKIQEVYAQNSVRIIRCEPKANGLSLIQTLKHSTTLNITATETPRDSKIMRVNNITNYLEAGRMKFLRDSSYEIAIQQLCAFPNSSKDGLVDCSYYIVNNFLNKNSTMKYARA